MPELRALVFDVDGTLAETEEHGHRPAFNQAFEEAGLPWHWDRDTYARLLRTTGGKERIAAWRPDAPPEQIAHLHARKTELYAQRVRAGQVQLRPGVAALIAEARAAGITLAIATTTTERNVHELLAATLGPEAIGWFAAIGAGDVVARKKPAPDIWRWVLQRLGLPAAEALALEDSAVGATSALAAGLPVVVARSAYTQHDALPAGVRAVQALQAGWAGVTLADVRGWCA
jgi:beta-phosphoglucomutase-like phosphatase (HAD superfamily)